MIENDSTTNIVMMALIGIVATSIAGFSVIGSNPVQVPVQVPVAPTITQAQASNLPIAIAIFAVFVIWCVLALFLSNKKRGSFFTTPIMPKVDFSMFLIPQYLLEKLRDDVKALSFGKRPIESAAIAPASRTVLSAIDTAVFSTMLSTLSDEKLFEIVANLTGEHKLELIKKLPFDRFYNVLIKLPREDLINLLSGRVVKPNVPRMQLDCQFNQNLVARVPAQFVGNNAPAPVQPVVPAQFVGNNAPAPVQPAEPALVIANNVPAPVQPVVPVPIVANNVPAPVQPVEEFVVVQNNNNDN